MKSRRVPVLEEQISRPPRGGRGLKCVEILCDRLYDWSPPSRGAWIEIVADL